MCACRRARNSTGTRRRRPRSGPRSSRRSFEAGPSVAMILVCRTGQAYNFSLMTIEQWLEDAKMDAYRRKLPELADLLEGLAQSTAALRDADWNDDASGRTHGRTRRGMRWLTVQPTITASRRASPAASCARKSSPKTRSPHRRAQSDVERVHHRHRRRSARRRRGRPTRKSPADVTAVRCTAFRCRSKDLIDMQGVPTTAASRLRAEHVARRDAPVTARLREAGAVFVGKTNLHEFAFGTTSEDSAGGRRAIRSIPRARPADRAAVRRSPSRPACRSRRVGTDTGGSIRIPAAACGIVGLKPGWDEISSRRRRAAQPAARSRRTAGAIGRRRRRAVRRPARRAPPNASSTRRSVGPTARAAWRLFHGSARRGCRGRDSRGRSTACDAPARRSRRDAAACGRHRAGLSASRARRRRRRITPRCSTSGPPRTRPTCACGSRWGATFSPKTTCARCAAER